MINIMFSVIWLDVVFYMVKFVFGMVMFGIKNGNIEKLVVKIMFVINSVFDINVMFVLFFLEKSV